MFLKRAYLQNLSHHHVPLTVFKRKKWCCNMSLKMVRGGVTGFGDTLVSQTCHFLRVSRKGRGGRSRYIWYSTVEVSEFAHFSQAWTTFAHSSVQCPNACFKYIPTCRVRCTLYTSFALLLQFCVGCPATMVCIGLTLLYTEFLRKNAAK